MKLELARIAGFCYGVRRAVELAEQAAAQGTPCVMLGSIIHNQAVIGRLAEQGLRSVKTPEEVPDGASVIIRSHGESRAVYKTLESRGAQILDATCPNVTRIHEIVRQAEKRAAEEGVAAETMLWSDYREIAADWSSYAVSFHEDGMTIGYSPYEIACYAAGAQVYHLDYEQLLPMLSDHGKRVLELESQE